MRAVQNQGRFIMIVIILYTFGLKSIISRGLMQCWRLKLNLLDGTNFCEQSLKSFQRSKDRLAGCARKIKRKKIEATRRISYRIIIEIVPEIEATKANILSYHNRNRASNLLIHSRPKEKRRQANTANEVL